jgi:hypothetical protein
MSLHYTAHRERPNLHHSHFAEMGRLALVSEQNVPLILQGIRVVLFGKAACNLADWDSMSIRRSRSQATLTTGICG